MAEEIWKDVIGYEGSYQVSNLGRVKSNMPHNGTLQRIIRQHTTKKGYLGCGLYKNKKRKSEREIQTASGKDGCASDIEELRGSGKASH